MCILADRNSFVEIIFSFSPILVATDATDKDTFLCLYLLNLQSLHQPGDSVHLWTNGQG